jgi:hypothetical protein
MMSQYGEFSLDDFTTEEKVSSQQKMEDDAYPFCYIKSNTDRLYRIDVNKLARLVKYGKNNDSFSTYNDAITHFETLNPELTKYESILKQKQEFKRGYTPSRMLSPRYTAASKEETEALKQIAEIKKGLLDKEGFFKKEAIIPTGSLFNDDFSVSLLVSMINNAGPIDIKYNEKEFKKYAGTHSTYVYRAVEAGHMFLYHLREMCRTIGIEDFVTICEKYQEDMVESLWDDYEKKIENEDMVLSDKPYNFNDQPYDKNYPFMSIEEYKNTKKPKENDSQTLLLSFSFYFGKYSYLSKDWECLRVLKTLRELHSNYKLRKQDSIKNKYNILSSAVNICFSDIKLPNITDNDFKTKMEEVEKSLTTIKREIMNIERRKALWEPFIFNPVTGFQFTNEEKKKRADNLENYSVVDANGKYHLYLGLVAMAKLQVLKDQKERENNIAKLSLKEQQEKKTK